MRKETWVRACRIGFFCMATTIRPLSAQDVPGDTIAGKTHHIEEVEVTARRVPAKVSSVTPVQLMSQQDLNQLGLQNMADAVRRFAGTDVRDYGGIGGLKTVSVRNMGAAHTAVSYDGVAVSNCQAGQIDIGRFPLDNVALVSLSVGQGDDLLQSARHYASAGVLSIETERPHFDDGRTSAFHVRLRGGSFGYVEPSVRWWQQAGERTRLAVDGNFMRADGNYPFTLVNGIEVTKERRNNSDIHSWQGEANLYHTLRDSSELKVKAQYYYSERGLPGSVILYNSTSRERLWDENFFLQARYEREISPRWTLRAHAKYNHSWNRYEDTDVKYEGGKQTDVHRQDEYYATASLRWQPLAGLSLSLAQDGAVNTLRNNINNSPNPVRYTSLTALNARFQWQRLTLAGTLVNTYIMERVKRGTAPTDRKRLSPAFSVSYRPWEGQAFYVRAMYKNTFRVPTFNDLYYLRIGNTSLRPENAREYNVGLTWGGAPFPFVGNMAFTVDAYYNEVTDKIVAYPSTYVWRMANFGKVHIHGVDATWSAYVPMPRRFGLMLAAAYTWQKAVDLTDPDAKNYKQQLPYTPRHSGSVSLQLDTPWLQVGYSLTAAGKRYYMAQNIPANEIASYVEQTLSLTREFALGACRLRLQAEIVNLADEQYEVIKYYPMPGRAWRLGGTFSF